MSGYPEVGTALGRYRLLAKIGQGGMAVVYRALDPTLGREVAVKLLLPHLLGEREYAARFLREARAAARLRHPSIVEVYDFGGGSVDDDGMELPPYIVAELIDGTTLRAFLDERGALMPEVATLIAIELAHALDCAHRSGVIHRDLKPENVLIARDGRVLLTDFGIARIIEGESITRTGALLGSPAYMSPEQARGEAVDARSDLFALGTTLYLLCTGRQPFGAGDAIATVVRILEGKYEPPLARNPRIGDALARQISRLLAPQPDGRPADAATVARELQDLLTEVGMVDARVELRRYFADPGAYNRELCARVVTHSLRLAQEAAQQRRTPRALSLCDRVLAYEPQHPQALQLLAQLSARGRRGRTAAIIGAVAVLALGGAAAAWRWGQPAAPGPLPGQMAASAVAAAAEVGPGAADAAAFADGRASVMTGTPAGYDAGGGARLAADPPLAPRAAGVARAARSGAAALRERRRRRRPASSARAAAHASQDAAGQGGMVDAGAPPARAVADAAVPPYGELVIAIGPWCDAQLDGRAVGRSPLGKPLRVRAGEHRIRCRQPQSGLELVRTVRVRAGERRHVGGLLRGGASVHLRLLHGDAVRIDGRVYRKDLVLQPKRYRVDVLRAGQPVRGGWVTVSAPRCLLVDDPRLDCR